jgi:hypothetical protein
VQDSKRISMLSAAALENRAKSQAFLPFDIDCPICFIIILWAQLQVFVINVTNVSALE